MTGRGSQTKTHVSSETKRWGSICSNTRMYANNQKGYTILEAMLFLAITAAIFVMFANTFSGRQARSEFQVGSRDMESRIRDVINDTNTGYASSQENFSCRLVGSGGNARLEFNSEGALAELGTNEDCIFIGRILHFGTDDNTKYYTHSVAGARISQEPANPELSVVGNYHGSRSAIIPGATFEETLPTGLEFGWMQSNFSDGTNRLSSSFGILSKLETAADARSLSTFMLPIPPDSPAHTQSTANVASEIRKIGCGSSTSGDCYNVLTLQQIVTGLDNATLCFNSSGSSQHSIITVQGFRGNLTTDSVINEGSCPSV